MKDLVILVADGNIEATIRALLSRPPALGTRPITFDVLRHSRRDPGCHGEAHDLLRPLRGHYGRALVIFDRAWEGAPPRDAAFLEEEVRGRLASTGWGTEADVVVIDPELEVWVWSDSPKVDECLGWKGRKPPLRKWAQTAGLWPPGLPKPPDPKRLVVEALWETKTPRSSAMYARLARSVSVERCTDPSFARLKNRLRAWFPPVPERRSTDR